MPKFDVTAPDGQKFEVNAPEGATENDAIQYVQKQFYGPKQVDMPAPAKPVGQRMNDAIGSSSVGEVGRQLGLTARYGLQGAGDFLDLLATPFRAGMNALGANIQGRSGESLADTIGLPKPQGELENIIGKGAELMAGGAVPIGLASSVPRATSAILENAGAGLLNRAWTRAKDVGGRVSGQVAASPGMQTISNAGSGVAGESAKQAGGNENAQLAAAVAGGLLTPLALSGAQRAVNSVKSVYSRPQQQQAIDLTIRNIIDNGDYGIQYADVGGNIKNQLRRDIGEAMRSGNMDENAARRLIDYRLIGATPTRGTLTLDPAQVSREKNLAKIGINSADESLHLLGNIQNENNRAFIGKLNELGADSVMSPYAAGDQVLRSLGNTDDIAQRAISRLHAAALTNEGRSAALDRDYFTTRTNDLLQSNNVDSFVTPDIRRRIGRIADGTEPLNVDTADQLKSSIFQLQRNSSNGNMRHALGLVRQSLDETPLRPNQHMADAALQAFNDARNLNRTYMQQVEATPALEAARNGVDPDRFVQNFIVGHGGKSNVADLRALTTAVENDPATLDAIRGQIAGYLKGRAINGAADEVGKFSSSSYNKALQHIGDEKLRMFFNRDEIGQLKALGRASTYEQFQPMGSAVNNSNSGALALAGALDFIANNKILARVPMADSLFRTPAKNYATQIQLNQATNVPQGLLTPQPKSPRPIPYGLLTAPLVYREGQ